MKNQINFHRLMSQRIKKMWIKKWLRYKEIKWDIKL